LGRNDKLKKVVTQREGSCTFHVLVEVISTTEIRVHHDVRASVDAQLANEHTVVTGERRWIRTSDAQIMTDAPIA
jgi:hypothetical protein